MAASRMSKMEGELLYYRGLLYGAANQRSNGFVTSYPGADRSQFAAQAQGGDVASYGTVPAYSYAPSIPSLMAPALAASDYQRADSYDSSSSGSYSPAGEPPLEYSRSGDARTSGDRVDSSMWSYLQFNTSEPVDDSLYRE